MKTLKPSAEKRQLRNWLALIAVVVMLAGCLPLLVWSIPVAGKVVSGEEQFGAAALSLLGTLLFVVPFFLAGVGLLIWSLWPVIVGMKVSRPEVSVSGDAVRPGDTVSFRFRQTFKAAAEMKQASFQLMLRETAVYHRGTDTYTVTHEYPIQRFDLPPRQFQAGESLSDLRDWQIPEEGMHTFAATHNKLQWLIAVQVGISGWPDFKEEYEVRVLPERI